MDSGKTFIDRDLAPHIVEALKGFPVLTLTGPRQSGKSTLLRHLLDGYSYIDLSNPDTVQAAQQDPVGFLRSRPGKLIIDEAQKAPELFPMIKTISDERDAPGQYVLSGSQNFLLMSSIGESLAGRAAVMRLLPLSLREIATHNAALSPDSVMLQGGYPRLYNTEMDKTLFYDSYISTYVERDVADVLQVRNRSQFERFFALCATQVGNLTNYSAMANELDIDFATVKSWLSILQTSYITFELSPYSSNVGKRLTKTPKLFFYDTGLLCHLLGIETLEQLLLSPQLGAIYKNFIISEVLKSHTSQGRKPRLFFYRDDSKKEIDLLDFTLPSRHRLIEIKSSQTYNPKMGNTLAAIGPLLHVEAENRFVAYRGESLVNAGEFSTLTTEALLSGGGIV